MTWVGVVGIVVGVWILTVVASGIVHHLWVHRDNG